MRSTDPSCWDFLVVGSHLSKTLTARGAWAVISIIAAQGGSFCKARVP